MAEKVHKVLLVEDDLMLRKCLMQVLEKIGWEPEGVASMEEAVERLTIKQFSLVVTDYQLETSSTGLSLLSYMDKIGCRTPSILISATKSAGLGAAARGLGAFAFLEKPFGMKAFMDLCRQALFSGTDRKLHIQEKRFSENVI